MPIKLLPDALLANPEAAAESIPAEDLVSARTVTNLYTLTQVRLRLGDQHHLEPAHRIGVGRTSVMMLGWLGVQCVIAPAPQNTVGRLVLQEGELVLIRSFTGKSAFAHL